MLRDRLTTPLNNNDRENRSLVVLWQCLRRCNYLKYEFGDGVYTLRVWRDAMDELVRALDSEGLLSELFRHVENSLEDTQGDTDGTT